MVFVRRFFSLAAALASAALPSPAIATAAASSPGDGAVLQLWGCGAPGSVPDSQTWSLPSSGPPASLVQLLPSSLAVGVYKDSNATGSQLVVGRVGSPGSATLASQQWGLDDTGLLRSRSVPTHCAAAADPIPGSRVLLQVCNASDPLQRFVFVNGSSSSGGSGSGSGGTLRLLVPGPLGSPCLDAGSAASCSLAPWNSSVHCDPLALPSDRAADVASQLTAYDARLLLGGWYDAAGVPRLAVPAFSFAEALHGLGSGCGKPYTDPSTNYTSTGCPTSFPHATLLAASFNRSLWFAVGDAVGAEARAMHNQNGNGLLLWSPNSGAARDPRWGRAQETAGEDPAVVGEFGAAFVRGLQAVGRAGVWRAVGTLKHLLGYDVEGPWLNVSRHTLDVNVSAHDMAEYFAPPFVTAIEKGGAGSAMLAYDAINGLPGCVDAPVTQGIFRTGGGGGGGGGGVGFQGFFVSDCNAVSELYTKRGFVNSTAAAVAAAMLAGTDWDCGRDGFNAGLVEAVETGLLPLASVQAAAQRVLTAVYSLGLADPASVDPYAGSGPQDIDTPAHRALSLEAAVQGIVLLANNATADSPNGAGTPLLPLQLARLRRLAVLGPLANASEAMLSNYYGANSLVDSYTPLLRIGARAGPAGVGIAYAAGLANVTDNRTDGFAEAAAALAGADAGVVFVGLDQSWEREGVDRQALTLPGAQAALVQALQAVGKPLVLVLIHGGPLALEAVVGGPGRMAVVDALYPGQMGGEAVAMILFGEASPSGRLPHTVYVQEWADRRLITDMQLAPHGDGVPGVTNWYADDPSLVLWEFGWGLSYTSFSFEWVGGGWGGEERVVVRGEGEGPSFAVNVTNTGAVTSDVSALAFLHSDVPGEPLQQLFDFARAGALRPGESVVLTFVMGWDKAVGMRGGSGGGGGRRRLRVTIGGGGQGRVEGAVVVVWG
jgi:xylan 1,4-beta-xylosidase